MVVWRTPKSLCQPLYQFYTLPPTTSSQAPRRMEQSKYNLGFLLFVLTCFVLLSFSVSVEAYKNYTVGDSLGWYDTLEKPSVNYQKWVAGKNFSLGDFLCKHRNPLLERGSRPSSFELLIYNVMVTAFSLSFFFQQVMSETCSFSVNFH